MKQETLGRIAIGLSVTCVFVVGATIVALATPSIRATLGLTPAVTPSYPHGARIDVPASLYESSPYTVVLFARSDCAVCQRIKPWLSELVAHVERQSAARVVMVATNTPLDPEIAFAAEIGLDPGRVFPVSPQTLKVRQVPTVVLVDREGTVRYSLDGSVPEQQDAAISRIVTLAQSR